MTETQESLPRHLGPEPEHPFRASMSLRWKRLRSFNRSLLRSPRGILAIFIFAFLLVVVPWAITSFSWRETAVCRVSAVAGPYGGVDSDVGRDTSYWMVRTSCGTYSIDADWPILDYASAANLARALHEANPQTSYSITFQGWGPGRTIVGAIPLS